jgi:hypothetical protein
VPPAVLLVAGHDVLDTVGVQLQRPRAGEAHQSTQRGLVLLDMVVAMRDIEVNSFRERAGDFSESLTRHPLRAQGRYGELSAGIVPWLDLLAQLLLPSPARLYLRPRELCVAAASFLTCIIEL